MKPRKTTQAFAQLVTDTIEGRIRWVRSKPLCDKERAEIAEMQASPTTPRDAYGRWLASGQDFLSRFKREHNISDEEE